MYGRTTPLFAIIWLVAQMHAPLFRRRNIVNTHATTPAPHQEKFTFLYVAISAVAVTCAIAYSLFAGLTFLHGALLIAGCLLVGWAFVYNFMEVRRATLAKKPGEPAPTEPDPYGPHTVVTAAPTGDSYPHHEDYTESQGFDQSQLTARIPDQTPYPTGLFSRRRQKK
jgi:hypothetical protein